MKNLHALNIFFVGTPIFLGLIGFVNPDFLFFALLSTMLTGIFQIIIGIKMTIDEPQDKRLKMYVLGVIIYFLLLYIIFKIECFELLNYLLLIVPPLLALYLSWIIYLKQKKSVF